MLSWPKPRRQMTRSPVRTGGGVFAICRLLLVLVGLLASAMAKADFSLYVVDSAGRQISVFTSSGASSTFASFDAAAGVAFDASGNLYVADDDDNQVLSVTPDGVESVFATGFDQPSGVAFDAHGNLYVANSANGTISKVTSSGAVSTFAIGFNNPQCLVFDGNGNLYVANQFGGTVSMVTPAGAVSTFASGFNQPLGLVFDGSGNLYVANYGSGTNSGNGTVSLVTPSGVVSTYASGLNQPAGLAFDANGNLYVVNGGTISKITPAGATSTFASGLGSAAFLAMVLVPSAPVIVTQPQSQSTAASQAAVFSIVISGVPNPSFQWQRLPAGSSTWTHLTDGGSYSGSATPTLTVANTTLAMSGDQFQCVVTNASGAVTTNAATLTVVSGIVSIQPQNAVVAGNHVAGFSVAAIGANLSYQWQASTDGGVTWTTLANNITQSGATTPALTLSNVTAAMSGAEYECVITNNFGSISSNPATLNVEPFVIYAASGANNGNVSIITPAGVESTFPGGFDGVADFAMDAGGNLYVANSGNGTISMVTPGGVVSIFASGFRSPDGLAFGADGNLYVSDWINNNVSTVTPDGVVSTLATGLDRPAGLVVDASGNLYVANSGNNTVSVISPVGLVSTFVSGVSDPQGLALDGSQNLYVVNGDIGTVSKITPSGVISTVAGVFNNPGGVAFDANGDLYVSYQNAAENTVLVSEITQAGVVATFASGQYIATSLLVVAAPAAPAIIDPPTDQSAVASITNATFSVAVSGAPGSNTFQWQRLPEGGSTWGNLTDGGSYSGSATPTLTVTNTTLAMSGDQFQCVITNTISSITTNATTLTVAPVIINTQPQNQATAGSYSTVFTVAATGANLTYQWQVSTDGGMSWATLADNGTYTGVTTPTLMVDNTTLAMSGYEYDCVVTSSFGSVISSPATLSVQLFQLYAYKSIFSNGIVSKIASNGVASTLASGFLYPQGLALDMEGNLYVANGSNGTVSEITLDGVVSNFATGFSNPAGLVFDGNGNLYVANSGNGTVSVVTSAGVVSTFASGFNNPWALAFDGNGNLYVANAGNGTVSMVTTGGVVSTFASGFSRPQGLAFDGSGDLYVANNGNSSVSIVTPAGVVSAFASGFQEPDGLVFDGSGNLYVANAGNSTVSVVAPGGVVSTFASGQIAPTFLAIIPAPVAPAIISPPQGQTALLNASASISVATSGLPGSNTFQWQRLPVGNSNWVNLVDGGNYTGSNSPTLAVTNTTLAMSGDQFRCVVTNSTGTVTTQPATLTVVSAISVLMYVTNSTTDAISQITSTGVVSPLASGFGSPQGVAYDTSGNLYVANNGRGTISRLNPAGTISTIILGLVQPTGLALDANKNIYVANTGNGTVLKITPVGMASTFASGFNSPEGLAFDANKNLYVANAGNGTVSKITTAGVVSTFATGLQQPKGLAFSASGNLYVANSSNGTVSKVTTSGVVTTFASGFNSPAGVAFDANGNLYVMNSGNSTISSVTPAGIISQFASSGNGTSNFIAIITSAPTVLSQPQSQTVTAADNAVFNLSANGPRGSNIYQWQHLPAGSSTWLTLSDSTLYMGSTTASLSVQNTTVSMTGDNYRCVVTNAAGTTTSNSATLTVAPLTSPPASPVATLGAWQNLWFTQSQLNDPTVSAALAAPVGDGVTNLVKYAFNLDPFSQPGQGGNAPLPQPAVSNGNLVLTFNASQNDLNYTVQASTDLITWTTQGVAIQTNGSQITASCPIPASGGVFLRVSISVK